MKASTNLGHLYVPLGLFISFFASCTIFVSCSSFDQNPPTPVLNNYDFPSEILDSIFTRDIPEGILNVDNFLNKIRQNGMTIHEGTSPPEIYNPNGSNSLGVKFTIENDCIYDEKAPANVDSLYGKYEETIQITNQQNSFMAEVSYSSVADPDFPQYPSGLDRGSGTGYASGNGNNFTVFYKVKNGFFDKIPYQALWIISGTVSNPPNAREITNITKCLVMLQKGNDPEDKVANRGTIRIFKDAKPDWVQPDVVISDFTPTEGSYSTVVTINGSGFSTQMEENVVRFNNMDARILEANFTQIRAEVPKGAGTGPVTVQVFNKTDTGNEFNYIPVYTVSTLAGTGQAGFINGSGSSAQFDNPYAIAVDEERTIYVADTENDRIRKISTTEEVSTLGISDPDGVNDAIFNKPLGVAVDAQLNVYVADTENNRIRRITASGFISTLQRCIFIRCFDAFFNKPSGIAADTEGNVYLADRGNNDNESPNILKVTNTGEVSTLARTGQNPSGVAVDSEGNVFVADSENHRILKIAPEGIVTALGEATRFNNPSGVAVDADGNVYIADTANHQIQKITPEGEVSTLAGTGEAGFLDGIGSAAQFNYPSGVAIDAEGTIYVADSQNHRIRKMILE